MSDKGAQAECPVCREYSASLRIGTIYIGVGVETGAVASAGIRLPDSS
jgi:hypothetical protein